MSVLKSTGVNHIMNAIENFIPLPFMLLNRNRILLCQLICTHHGLFPVNPRRNKSRQTAGDILALFAHRMKGINGTLRLTAYLTTDIPSAETLVLLTVPAPHLINHILVILNLPT